MYRTFHKWPVFVLKLLFMCALSYCCAAASALYVERDEPKSLAHMRRALRAAWLELFSAPPDASPIGRAISVLSTASQTQTQT